MQQNDAPPFFSIVGLFPETFSTYVGTDFIIHI